MSKNIIFLLILWSITIVILLYNLFHLENGFFANGTIIIGWVLFILQYTMKHSEKFYFLIHRMISYGTNNSNQWNFQFEFFSKDFDINDLEAIVSEITMVKKSIDFNLSRKQITTENGMIIEISKNSSDDKVVFQISDYTVPYRESKKIIDVDISPIIETIIQDYSIEDIKFSLTIFLKNKNPYYGFLLNQVEKNSKLAFFQAKLKIGFGSVDILNNRIIISANKFTELSRIAKDILTFKATS